MSLENGGLAGRGGRNDNPTLTTISAFNQQSLTSGTPIAMISDVSRTKEKLLPLFQNHLRRPDRSSRQPEWTKRIWRAALHRALAHLAPYVDTSKRIDDNSTIPTDASHRLPLQVTPHQSQRPAREPFSAPTRPSIPASGPPNLPLHPTLQPLALHPLAHLHSLNQQNDTPPAPPETPPPQRPRRPPRGHPSRDTR